MEILGAVVPKTRIFILVLAVVCVAVLATVLKVSPMGRRIRAVVQNRDLAETSGISSAAGPISPRSSSVPGWPVWPVWR